MSDNSSYAAILILALPFFIGFLFTAGAIAALYVFKVSLSYSITVNTGDYEGDDPDDGERETKPQLKAV